MSLAARVTALAQAIGADIKDLRTKVGSTIVASAHNSPVAPTVVAINVPHGAWAVLPLPTALSPTSSDGVNPDFTRNADGSITFNKAGTYNIATTAGSANSPIPGSVGSTATTVDLRLVLTSANKATVHDVNDPQVAMARDLAPAGEYWIKSLAANVEVVVGQRIGAVAFAGGPTDTNLGISMFSVVRAGSGPAGPKGDKGDPGPVGGTVYGYQSGAGTSVSPANTWKTVPIAAPTLSEPAGAFTRNADGSVTVRDAGWYQVSATVHIATPNLYQLSIGTAPDAPGSICEDYSLQNIEQFGTPSGAVKLAAGAKLYVTVYSAATNIFVREFSIAGIGPQGPKGDVGPVGGNATVPMDTVHLVGAAGEPAFVNAWTSYGAPLGAARFRKDPLGKVRLAGAVKGGTSTTIFTLPAGYRPATEVEFVIDQAHTAGIIIIQANGIVGVITLGAAFVSLEGIEFDTESVTQMPTGPQGPKGDPGGVNVLTTLDWNTALTPNFYRSSTDFLAGNTLHGPGDTLNPPPQAGVVSTLDNGTLVQRVWDLQMQRAYTRYLSGGIWTAWAADLAKPPVLTGQIVGGATPEEGDERYFQTAEMLVQGVIWKFRYNKAQNKWHFVGGSEFLFATPSLAAVAGASAIDATNLAFTAVLSGSYDVSWGARMYQNPSGPSSGNILLFADQMRGASAITSPGMDLWAGPISGQTWSTVVQNFKTFRFDPVQNGDVIRLRSQSINYNAAIESPIMRIKPVSVLM